MSNGSFLTSQLPVTTNAVGSDRLLVLWNAAANVEVGSGTPQTMMIGLTDFVNSAMSTIETDLMTFGTMSLGNSTVNTVINSTSLYIQTNLGTKFAVNTAGVIVGNGAGITSLPAPGANSQILFNNSGSSAAAANLTWNGATLSVGDGSTNTTVNSSVFMNGNAYINSTTLMVGNSGKIIVGNVTYNVAITPQSLTVSNNGNTMWTVTGDGIGTIRSQFNVGNSTANAVVVPSAITIANATASLSLNLDTFGVVNTATGGSFNLPGGWHMAFGLVQTNSIGSNTVTFANAFSSNAYSVTATVLLGGAANSFAVTVVDRAHVNSVTKTGFTLWTGNSSANATANVYYQAIGY